MLVEVKFGSTTCQLNHFKPRALLGSDPQSAELTVADPSVSRRHAEIYIEGDVVYLRDLGSAAGTWINGQPVGAQPAALAPGAMVHVGQTSLGVHWPAKGSNARTDMSPPPPQLVALIQQRQQQQAAPPPAGRSTPTRRRRATGSTPSPVSRSTASRRSRSTVSQRSRSTPSRPRLRRLSRPRR